ncbi:MAG: phosphoribosylformylglycinamidine synthase subunit PurQ [Planctomycetes bacterium]|nr:phosphoribosylformylglycinamidine synthase subunit PurQ [Planctomycetota bacterium]
MTQVRVLILRAAGTNCDKETAFAFQRAGAVADRVHVEQVKERPALLGDYQVLCIPGGFSYGDDIAAGKIFANQLHYHLADALRAFHDAGKLILGVCNGFQVLLKAGLLPGDDGESTTTLVFNDSGQFEDRWVYLDVTPGRCVFLQGVDRLYLPVAHAEGKFVGHNLDVIRQLEVRGQVVLRYTAGVDDHAPGAGEGGRFPDTGLGLSTLNSRLSTPYPANPNGSWADVAGLCDTSGRTLGLMPHPERHIDATQHPRWSRLNAVAEGDGLALFRNAVRYFQ